MPDCQPGGVGGANDYFFYTFSVNAPVFHSSPQDVPSVPTASKFGSSLDAARREGPFSAAPHLLLSHAEARLACLHYWHFLNSTMLLSSFVLRCLSHYLLSYVFIPFCCLHCHFNGVSWGSSVRYERYHSVMVKSTTSRTKCPGFKLPLCYLPVA